MLRLFLCLIVSLSIINFSNQLYDFSHSSIETEKSITNTYGSFHIETIRSFDGRLRLEIDDENTMIRLNIFDEKTDEKVYSFEPVRKWDFWGVCFENDNYNIWIQSGDVGTICFEFYDGVWRYNPSAIKPTYIITK